MNKTFWRVTLFACFLAGGLFACATTPAASSERVALEAAIQRWNAAVNAQDAATLASTMTDDVELLGDPPAAKGRDAAIRALRETVRRGQLIARSHEITMGHEFAWHVAGLSQTEKGGDVHAMGLALEIWNRVNGEWKLHRRMVTGGTTPGTTLVRPSTNEPVLDQRRE